MKNKIYIVIASILFIIGGINSGIIILMTTIGSLFSGKPFHIIYGANGPIPNSVPVFQTEFFAVFVLGILFMISGLILLKMRKKQGKENVKKS